MIYLKSKEHKLLKISLEIGVHGSSASVRTLEVAKRLITCRSLELGYMLKSSSGFSYFAPNFDNS